MTDEQFVAVISLVTVMVLASGTGYFLNITINSREGSEKMLALIAFLVSLIATVMCGVFLGQHIVEAYNNHG